MGIQYQFIHSRMRIWVPLSLAWIMSTAPSLVSPFSISHDPPPTLPQEPEGAYIEAKSENVTPTQNPPQAPNGLRIKLKEFSPSYQALHDLIPSVVRSHLSHCPPSLALNGGPQTYLSAPLHLLLLLPRMVTNSTSFRHVATERHFLLAPISKAPLKSCQPRA